MAAARAADARTYAGDTLATAEKALSQYDAAVDQRDYKQALRLALEARDRAYEATRRSGDEKAAARSRAEHLAHEVEELIRDAEVRATQPGLGRAALERLRASTRSAASVLQETRSDLAAQRYRAAASALAPIAECLRADLAAASAARRSR